MGKTLMVRSLGEILSLSFSRIQFTPDLMPADITGTVLTDDPSGRKIFEFQRGPVFAHIVLADEINRATPKTQSALLEAMQEQSVTVGGKVHRLENPFMVLATQNPIEMEGTYPLPEAQVDRFFFKLLLNIRLAMSWLALPISQRRDHRRHCAKSWTRGHPADETMGARCAARRHCERLCGSAVLSTHPQREPGKEAAPLAQKFVLYGSSPGTESVILAAKARALLAGRPNVSFEDIRQMLLPSLRHRLILNLEADAEGIGAEKILSEVVERVAEVS